MFLSSRIRCSFCRKKDTEVSKLVAGPRVYICDACVAIARRLMEDAGDNQNLRPVVESSWWRRVLSRALGFLTPQRYNRNRDGRRITNDYPHKDVKNGTLRGPLETC